MTKRLIIATFSGFICSLICLKLASGNGDLPNPAVAQIIISRTLIGFAIGISSLKIMHWSLHGLFFGFIFSLPLACGTLMAPESPDFSPTNIFLATIVMGMIYGFIIELITSIFFSAKISNKE